MCLGPSLGPELVLQGARWGIPCLEGRRRRREKRRCCTMEGGREGEKKGRGEAVLQHLPPLWAAGAVGNGQAELLDQFSALFVLHTITQTPVSPVQVPVSPGVLRVL